MLKYFNGKSIKHARTDGNVSRKMETLKKSQK